MSFLETVSDFVFGSGGDTKERRLPLTTEQQQQALNFLLRYVQDEIAQGEQITDAERELLGELFALSGGLPSPGQLTGISEAGFGTVEDLLAGGPAFDIDRVFQESVADPLIRDFNENLIPAIQARFGEDFFGGERRQAEARAEDELIEQLVRGRSDLTRELINTQLASQVAGLQNIASPLAPAGNTQNILAGILEAQALPRTTSQEQQNFLLQLLSGASTTPTVENALTERAGKAGMVPIFLENFAQSYGRGTGTAAALGTAAAF